MEVVVWFVLIITLICQFLVVLLVAYMCITIADKYNKQPYSKMRGVVYEFIKNNTKGNELKRHTRNSTVSNTSSSTAKRKNTSVSNRRSLKNT